LVHDILEEFDTRKLYIYPPHLLVLPHYSGKCKKWYLAIFNSNLDYTGNFSKILQTFSQYPSSWNSEKLHWLPTLEPVFKVHKQNMQTHPKDQLIQNTLLECNPSLKQMPLERWQT